jgi:hypothetical protein
VAAGSPRRRGSDSSHDSSAAMPRRRHGHEEAADGESGGGSSAEGEGPPDRRRGPHETAAASSSSVRRRSVGGSTLAADLAPAAPSVPVPLVPADEGPATVNGVVDALEFLQLQLAHNEISGPYFVPRRDALLRRGLMLLERAYALGSLTFARLEADKKRLTKAAHYDHAKISRHEGTGSPAAGNSTKPPSDGTKSSGASAPVARQPSFEGGRTAAAATTTSTTPAAPAGAAGGSMRRGVSFGQLPDVKQQRPVLLQEASVDDLPVMLAADSEVGARIVMPHDRPLARSNRGSVVENFL